MDFCQFAHMSLYPVSPHRRGQKWECVDGITKEGARVPGACGHLKYPKRPQIIFGVSPLEAGATAKERAALARDSVGRKLKCDGKVLCAIVISYPVPRWMVEQDPREKDTHFLWQQQTRKWLETSFGPYLLSIVEHADESYLHLHAYAVPQLLPDNQLDWDAFHPGRKAAAAAAASGATLKEQNVEYCAGMTRWQDDYHAAVSARFGHLRHGPRRERVLRMTHKANKAIAENKANVEADLKRQQADIDRQREALERDRARIEEEAHRAAHARFHPHLLALRDDNALLKQHKAALMENLKRMSAALIAETAQRKGVEAEIEVLHQRLTELAPDALPRLAA